MADLLGITSITLVSLFTYLLAIRYPSVSKIILAGLILRIIFLLIDHYLFPLPASTADAESFEGKARSLSKYGFIHLIQNFSGPDPYFISYFIAIPFSLLGISVLMAQSISLFFGIGSIFLVWLLAKKIWNDRIANTVGWVAVFFPSLVLFSVIVLREVYVCFFLLIALHGIVDWVKTDKLRFIILATFGFTGATFFHGAMIVGLIVFGLIVTLVYFKKLLTLIINFRINIKISILLVFFLILSGLITANKIHVPYLGTFDKATNPKVLFQKTNLATAGDASWPKWTIINSTTELIYKAPIRSIYIVFSPFPWDIKKISHIIGIFDSFLYIYLSILILLNIKIIWKDPCLRIILIILLAYIFVFGIGVGNFGTGIRHRSKFVLMFILLAAPFIKRLVLNKT